MENKNETPTTNKNKFRTYFYNNLVVMKDKILFCLLFKLISLHQLEYNKAKKHGKPTNDIKFQFSTNEFILDTQISKSSLLRKMEILEKLKLISKTKTKEDNNANGKNEYQVNITLLEEIVSKLDDKKRKDRIIYINQIFGEKTEKKILSIEESFEAENEQKENLDIPTPAEIEKENNIKKNEALDKLQRQQSIELMAKFKQREEENRKAQINTNKAIGATQIQNPTPTTKEKMKIGTGENIGAEKQIISSNDIINEYEKDNVQLALISLLNNKNLPLSDEFRNSKMYFRIIDCLGSKDYHNFLMNAYAKDGFYTLSKDYLNGFNEKDRTTLLDFINCYIRNCNEVEEERKGKPAA